MGGVIGVVWICISDIVSCSGIAAPTVGVGVMEGCVDVAGIARNAPTMKIVLRISVKRKLTRRNIHLDDMRPPEFLGCRN